ncbi:Xaa-Pro peptidase family protein [Thermomicrobiaceae bacterium CFH 74404]|uniref:Xaa-Pro peptidase family protein n=1 Tax=Thermalbibacter longus TaxID=2951981 RepID=A0AA42BAT7_9BACT|nr:Xaa-Pro peptidase family protein [Thermalbibacter longus]MCM8750107.1 Xaa-Pro peptidase family protein [Thermalbibacter longus]
MPRLRLSDAEYLRRRATILQRLGERDITAVVVFGPNNVSYFSRFGFIPTERPIAFVLTRDTSALLVPRLELEHAQEFALTDRIVSYPEYPDLRHPMEFLKDILVDLRLSRAKIGVDSDGYGQLYGYRGPKVSELLPEAEIVNVADDIEYMQMINSEEELELLRESARWANLAHAYLQEYCRVGATETEISMRASYEASQAMIRTLGPEYRPLGRGLASAGFRGQIGKDSALPHAMTSNARLKPGDILVTGATAYIWGYSCELERTMIMGEPSPEQERFFNLMLEVQTLAIQTIKPGIPCSAVDKAVRDFFKENGLEQYWRHHTGHAKSTLVHEAPFLDVGDQQTIEVGMVFTVEPGIYVPELGGFRHSDTVAVTPDGVEMITYYPRDLASLVIPV